MYRDVEKYSHQFEIAVISRTSAVAVWPFQPYFGSDFWAESGRNMLIFVSVAVAEQKKMRRFHVLPAPETYTTE